MTKRCAIVGAGISGLSAAYFLQKKDPSVEIDVYDADSRIGGVIRSEKFAGCVLEGGPDSFLTMKKSAARLCQAIGLESEMVHSNDDMRKTFVYHDGKLKPLPDGFFMMVPTEFLPLVTTDLFTWPGKLEALSDLFSFPEEQDCTVADFLQRRFGKEVLERIAEPMISGIYGADISRLSLESALPQIWAMQKKGSLIAQLVRQKFHRNSAPKEPLFTTLANGMESIVIRLREKIRANWKCGHPVESITRNNGKWSVEEQPYDAVVIASPKIPSVPGLEEVSSIANHIQRNSAIVIAFGFDGLKREGFGWLVPASERRSILAATYVTNKFPGRSSEGTFLVRAFIGGDEAAKWIDASDQQLQIEVLKELKRIGKIEEEPLFCRIFRWKHAMPEYQPGHRKKIESMRAILKNFKNIGVTGNIFSGVGLPDCIQHAENIISELEI
jgi:protoporphyrinogen/coproporphyrinogen III oxidase